MGSFLFVMLVGGVLVYLNRKVILQNNANLRALLSVFISRMEAYLKPEIIKKSLVKIVLVIIGLFIIGGPEIKAWVIFFIIIGVMAYILRHEISSQVTSFKKNYLQPGQGEKDKWITTKNSNTINEKTKAVEPINKKILVTSNDIEVNKVDTEPKEIAKIVARRKNKISYEEAEEPKSKEAVNGTVHQQEISTIKRTDEPVLHEINTPVPSKESSNETGNEQKEIAKVLAQRKIKRIEDESKDGVLSSKPPDTNIIDKAISFLRGLFNSNQSRHPYERKESRRSNDRNERRSRSGNYLK